MPPFEFIDNGEIVGFDIDLARMFAKSLGVELEVVDTAWAGVIASLYSQKFDMIWSALPITDARLKAINFSQVYATDQPVFLIRADDDKIKSLADFKGKVLGTQLNTSIEEQSKALSEKEKLNLDIKLYDHIDTAYLDLANGNLDIVTTAITNFSELDKKMPGKFKIMHQLPPQPPDGGGHAQAGSRSAGGGRRVHHQDQGLGRTGGASEEVVRLRDGSTEVGIDRLGRRLCSARPFAPIGGDARCDRLVATRCSAFAIGANGEFARGRMRRPRLRRGVVDLLQTGR